jgi:hypothetical protein
VYAPLNSDEIPLHKLLERYRQTEQPDDIQMDHMCQSHPEYEWVAQAFDDTFCSNQDFLNSDTKNINEDTLFNNDDDFFWKDDQKYIIQSSMSEELDLFKKHRTVSVFQFLAPLMAGVSMIYKSVLVFSIASFLIGSLLMLAYILNIETRVDILFKIDIAASMTVLFFFLLKNGG